MESFVILISIVCLISSVVSGQYAGVSQASQSSSSLSSPPLSSYSNSHLASSQSASSASSSSFSSSYSASSSATSASSSQSSSDSPNLLKKKIICLFNSQYYYKEQFTPSLIDPTLCTHINYEFAFLDSSDYHIIIGDPKLDIQQNFYKEVTSLKDRNPSLKVLLSLGGWADSTKKYSQLVADPAKRKSFIEHVIPFLKEHEFDGLDVAWEYPNGWQGAIGICHQDKANFAIFLGELREAFDKHNLELSVSVAAVKEEIQAAYEVPALAKAVHHINVMTFDLHGPWEHMTGHHTQFSHRPQDTRSMNVKASLQDWVDHGAPKDKLNMGIAAYGRSFTLLHPKINGMDAPISGVGKPGENTKEGGYLAYNEICQNLNFRAWTEREDTNAGPYAFKDDQWVSYDSPKQVVRKVKFAIDQGFGGVLFKGLSGDDYKGICYSVTFPLLRTLKLEILRRERIDD